MDPPMTSRLPALLLAVLVLAGALVVLPGLAPSARAATTPTKPVTGNLTGPTLLAWKAAGSYVLRGTGGPAVLPNGTIVGNLTYWASVSGINTSGVSITPDSSGIVNGGNNTLTLATNNVSQTLTITIEIASVLNATNVSTNFTYNVVIVQPYTVSTTMVNIGSTTVLGFPVQVLLDGNVVGVVSVPSILAHQTYQFTYNYATLGLSPGTHTFSISLLNEHGLVRFANGSTVYSQSFYIPSPPPSYTLWYAVGIVAFLGALLIFGARVGARRRSPTRK
jgi:hypothetical protein